MDAKAGRALFYVFVESMASPADDPLVLWLNGCVIGMGYVGNSMGVHPGHNIHLAGLADAADVLAP